MNKKHKKAKVFKTNLQKTKVNLQKHETTNVNPVMKTAEELVSSNLVIFQENLVDFKPSLFLKKQAEITRPVIDLTNFKELELGWPKKKNFKDSDLSKLVCNPHHKEFNNLINLAHLSKSFLAREISGNVVAPIENLLSEASQGKEIYPFALEKQFGKTDSVWQKVAQDLSNLIVSPNLFTDVLPRVLHTNKVKKLLILTDTDYQQTTATYNKLIRCLREHGVMYVGFTNIQPEMTKVLINDVAEYAKLHNIDSILTFGSWPLIDFAKLVTLNVGKSSFDGLNTLKVSSQKSKEYLVLSLPTVVCMEDGVNARTVIKSREEVKNKVTLSEVTTLCVVDNSDYGFLYPELFAELSEKKLKEVLVESYFRTIQNFFDFRISPDAEKLLIEDTHLFVSLLRKLKNEENLTSKDFEKMAYAIARNVDGTSYIVDPGQWRWYLLESSLSSDLNSSRAEGLALFAPGFIEYESEIYPQFEARCKILAQKLFGRESVKGLTLGIMRFNEEFNLPRALFDISQVKKVNALILSNITKKGGNTLFPSYRSAKRIVESISLY